jgi:hypothetical protein
MATALARREGEGKLEGAQERGEKGVVRAGGARRIL